MLRKFGITGFNGFQVDNKIGRRLIPQLPVLGEHLVCDPFELHRHPCAKRREGLWILVQNIVDQCLFVVAREGGTTSNHFIQKSAEAPDVCSAVHGLTFRLLRTHKGDRTERGPHLC